MKNIYKFLLLIISLATMNASSLSYANTSQHAKKISWNLAAVMIFRNEAPYLKEWLEFNKLIGVEHFILYNNLSTDNYVEVLQPYINNGDVELIEWNYEFTDHDDWLRIQRAAYNDALQKTKNTTKWLAIIDSDEFLVPVLKNNLQVVLKNYEKTHVGGVTVSWVNFGTSGVKKIPDDKLMTETLLLNGGVFKWSKSIVRPTRVIESQSAHACIFKKSYYNVKIFPEEVQLNHYWSRDEYYMYNFKIPRRCNFGAPASEVQDMEKMLNMSTQYSLPILRFIPTLRKRMGFQ